jgi:hypothetical protein
VWESKENGIFVVELDASHMVEGSLPFDKEDYYSNPRKYKPIFHSKYLKYINVLVNCNYYDSRYPKLITKDQIKVNFFK